MQKVNIDIYISDLLYRFDCVVIPEFGGFVANYASAKIQPIQHRFSPPSKNISFNENLKNNDGLLVNHLAERQSISYEKALEFIESFVSQTRHNLKQGDRIKIEKLGTLYLNAEGNIQFTAEETNDFLRDSFGLKSFRATPIIRESKEAVFKGQIAEAVVVAKEESKQSAMWWKVAATFLLFLVASFLLNQQYNWLDSTNAEYAFLNIGSSSTASEYSYRKSNVAEFNFEDETVVENEFTAEYEAFVLPNAETTAIVVKNPKTKLDHTLVAKATKKNLIYHVMGGCFSDKTNAEKLVKKLSKLGFYSSLLGEYKNLHAVAYQSFATREEAIDLLSEVRNSDNPDAWLLVRPF